MTSDTKDIEVANLAKQEDEFAFLNGDAKAAEPTEPEETPVETPDEKPVEKPTEPTKIQHPRYLVEIARRLGASDEQIANIPSDQLGSMIEGHMAQIQASARQPEPAPAKKAEPEEDPDEADIAYLEKEVGVDPKVAALLRRQSKRVKELEGKKLAEAEAKIRELEELDRRRAEQQRAEFFDSTRDSLPEEFRTVFGKSGEQNQKQQGRYIATIMQAGIDPEKDSPTVMRRKIREAAVEMWGEFVGKTPEKTEKQATKKEEEAPKKNGISKEDWDAAVLGRPTATKPKKTKGEEAAKEVAREWYRERGIPFRPAQEDEFDGVPG